MKRLDVLGTDAFRIVYRLTSGLIMVQNPYRNHFTCSLYSGIARASAGITVCLKGKETMRCLALDRLSIMANGPLGESFGFRFAVVQASEFSKYSFPLLSKNC